MRSEKRKQGIFSKEKKSNVIAFHFFFISLFYIRMNVFDYWAGPAAIIPAGGGAESLLPPLGSLIGWVGSTSSLGSTMLT